MSHLRRILDILVIESGVNLICDEYSASWQPASENISNTAAALSTTLTVFPTLTLVRKAIINTLNLIHWKIVSYDVKPPTVLRNSINTNVFKVTDNKTVVFFTLL